VCKFFSLTVSTWYGVVFVGGYGAAAAYSAGAPASGYSVSYPVGSVTGYTSYGASAYGSGTAASYNSGYAAYGSSSGWCHRCTYILCFSVYFSSISLYWVTWSVLRPKNYSIAHVVVIFMCNSAIHLSCVLFEVVDSWWPFHYAEFFLYRFIQL